MFSVPHIVVIFIVVLVVFGPHKLPELARGLGKMMAEFRKASTDFRLAFEEEMRNIERQARETELKKVQEASAAGSAAQQPPSAALATESERILPPPTEPIEPTVTPVEEAVAREAVTADEPQATEAIAPGSEASSAILPSESGDIPSNDQRPA
jgi:sec-independent protein translocase protein TatB